MIAIFIGMSGKHLAVEHLTPVIQGAEFYTRGCIQGLSVIQGALKRGLVFYRGCMQVLSVILSVIQGAVYKGWVFSRGLYTGAGAEVRTLPVACSMDRRQCFDEFASEC